MNDAQEYLKQFCSLMGDQPHKFKRLLAIGSSPSREPLTADEQRSVRALKRAVRPRIKACFENCQRALLLDFKQFRYWEGFVTIPGFGSALAFEHAWLTLNGKLVDVTPHFEGQEHYFGVPIEAQIVREFMLEGKLHGPLLDDVQLRWKYTQKILGGRHGQLQKLKLRGSL